MKLKRAIVVKTPLACCACWKRAMIDLSPRNLELVKRVLRDHVPGCEVRAFGSRAKWTAKDHSDLDLAVIGESELESATLASSRRRLRTRPCRCASMCWIGTTFRRSSAK